MNVRLKIEGIRCFSTLQEATLRPLTILVGENSSGKTTFLALCKIMCSTLEGYSQIPSFNEPPFSMGAFEQIASYVGGRAGRVKEFSLCAEFAFENQEAASLHVVFTSEAGQPTMRSWCFASGPWKMSVERNEAGGIRIVLRGKSKKAEFALPRETLTLGLKNISPMTFIGPTFYEMTKDFHHTSELYGIDEY